MEIEITPVSVDRIDTADHTFKITTNTDTNDLTSSIGSVGLLQPPILMPMATGYRTVTGFRRIAACEGLNLTPIAARLLPPDTSPMVCAQMAVADNALQRPLNLIEQSRAYALLNRLAGHSPTWLNMAASVGLTGSQAALDRVLPIADMPACLQTALLEGSIALPTALQIQRLSLDDRLVLCEFFRRIHTGLNLQREILTLIGEISLRDDTSMAAVLAQDELRAVIDNPDIPAPQKVQQLRKILKTKRYPALSHAEALYDQQLKRLKLDPCVQLHHPPFFEGRSYRLTLAVESRRQLKSLISELERLVRHPDLIPE